MPEPIDIYRTAHALIERHGDTAAIHAAERADAMLAKGDLDGRDLWRAILKAVDDLSATAPRKGEPVH